MDDAIKAALLDAAVLLENAQRNFNMPDPTLATRGQYKAMASHIRQLLMEYADGQDKRTE